MGVANNLPWLLKAIRTSSSRKRAISPHPARTNNYIHDVNYLILWSRTHSGLDFKNLARPLFPLSRMRRKNGLVHETKVDRRNERCRRLSGKQTDRHTVQTSTVTLLRMRAEG